MRNKPRKVTFYQEIIESSGGFVTKSFKKLDYNFSEDNIEERCQNRYDQRVQNHVQDRCPSFAHTYFHKVFSQHAGI